MTTAEGQWGAKAQELALAAEFDQQIDSTTLDEFTVKVYGDMAIVWFTERLVGPKQGLRVEVTYRYTDVFVRRAALALFQILRVSFLAFVFILG